MPGNNKKSGNGKKLNSRQSVDQAVKAIADIMRRGNMAGAMQYVPELTWILFLRILDETEQREQEEAETMNCWILSRPGGREIQKILAVLRK